MKKKCSDLLLSAILAAVLAVMLDFVSVWFDHALSVPKFAALLAAVFLAVWLLPTQRVRRWMAAVLGGVWALLLAAALCWYSVSQSVIYDVADQGKSALYGGKSVMLLVPHQDDDINVLGGVVEEYVKYGSEVRIVFSTNGDYYGLAETRFREALAAAERMGVPAQNVIFLGYGDGWDPEGPHLYNAAPGTVMTSAHGSTETYGTAAKEVYRPGTAYTIENFLSDIEAVILEHRPEILYCVDHDYNIDHRALSLSFEKVMGRILAEEPDYRPLVFKGFAYDTAWEAVKDFYGENLLSTQNVFVEPYAEKPGIYRWEERVRLPVHGESLSRSLVSAELQGVLAEYASQWGELHGVRIFNSDKVFWRRRTDSVCYGAEISVSSGSAELLHDFMLLEDHDLLTDDGPLTEGAWIPGDAEKWAQVRFETPVELYEVALYDHPDKTCNVLNAVITFDDGAWVETGPLDPGGAATRIVVEKAEVSGFRVTLTQWEGEAGLTELEAYTQPEGWEQPYVKLMDGAGNFAYDYWIDPSGSQSFALYVRGAEPAAADAYTLTSDNPACTAVWEGEGIIISCPAGESAQVTVTSADGRISDTVRISNPTALTRRWQLFWLGLEEKAMEACEKKLLLERLFVCRLWEKGAAFLLR